MNPSLLAPIGGNSWLTYIRLQFGDPAPCASILVRRAGHRCQCTQAGPAGVGPQSHRLLGKSVIQLPNFHTRSFAIAGGRQAESHRLESYMHARRLPIVRVPPESTRFGASQLDYRPRAWWPYSLLRRCQLELCRVSSGLIFLQVAQPFGLCAAPGESASQTLSTGSSLELPQEMAIACAISAQCPHSSELLLERVHCSLGCAQARICSYDDRNLWRH